MTPLRAALSILAVACAASSARAEQGVVSWTTFLYDAPSPRARVIDEPPLGAPVEVGECSAGWCRATLGRSAGYLKEETIARPGAPGPLENPALRPLAQGPAKGPCFTAGSASVATPPAPMRYCPD